MHRVTGLLATALTALAMLLAFGPALAHANGTTATDGVSATLTVSFSQFTETLVITARGAPAFSTTFPCENGPCTSSVTITRLSPGPRPDVILESSIEGGGGGVYVQDFSWSVPQDTWVQSAAYYHDEEGQDPRLESLGGGYSGFVSNDSLPGLSPGPSAIGPIVIQRPRLGVLVDEAVEFPAVVAADAAHWFSEYQSAPASDNADPLAAWAADESIIGEGPQAKAYLHSVNGQLELGGQPVSAATIIHQLAADGYPLS